MTSTPAPAPPQPKRRSTMPVKIIAGGIGAIALLAVGVSAGSEHATSAPPAPAPTVTVSKPTTPAACISALGDADKVMRDYNQAIGTVGPALDAIQSGDVQAVNDATTQIANLNPVLKSDLSAYTSDESQCKDAG